MSNGVPEFPPIARLKPVLVVVQRVANFMLEDRRCTYAAPENNDSTGEVGEIGSGNSNHVLNPLPFVDRQTSEEIDHVDLTVTG